MIEKSILDSARLDFFIFLAYLITRNVKSAQIALDDQLQSDDLTSLINLENYSNPELDKDIFLYKGRQFYYYLNYLLVNEIDYDKLEHLLSLNTEIKDESFCQSHNINLIRNN